MPSVPDVNLCQSSISLFDDICVRVNKAVVFADDGFAEILHWHGGVTSLLNAGVQDVREFNSFESGDTNQPKAAFFISTPFTDKVFSILQDIICVSNFRRVSVFSNIPPMMHSVIEYHSTEDEMRAFDSFRMQILQWLEIKNEGCFAELVYLPLVAAPVLPSLFLLPAHHNVFPLLPTDVQHVKQKYKAENRGLPGLSDVEFGHLPRDLQLRLKLLTCSLNSVMELLSISEEVFAAGCTSNIVAAELAALGWNKARKKNSQRKASLVIIDRTLDMASVVGHFQDSLLDRILSVLPRLPGHQVDVAVEMMPICVPISNLNFLTLAPGCLSHPDDPVATPLLNTLAMLKQKEAVMEISRHLIEALGKESLEVKAPLRPGKIGIEQLAANVASFKGKTMAIKKHCGLLQLVLAIIQTIGHPGFAKLDSLLALEKGLLQCLGDEDSQSPVRQILQIIRQDESHSSGRFHSVDDFLLLLVFICSLSSDHCDMTSEEKAEMKLALTAAMTDCGKEEEIIRYLDLVHKGDQAAMFEDILDKLRNLPRARDGLKKYRNIYEPGSLSSQAKLQPILKQIVEDIVDPSRPDLVDVAHKSVGFGDMLKSGFGLFRSVGKPRPSDHPLLILFVIGGITSTEVRQVRDVVSAAKGSLQVLVGSTSLASPTDILKKVLFQDNLLDVDH